VILEATDLRVRYRGLPVPALDGVSLRLEAGRLLAVVGPNGSGKSTLIRALTGAVPLESGEARLGGRPVSEWAPAEFARQVGVVTQREDPVFPLKVQESVLLGRYAHLGPVAAAGSADLAAVAEAMVRCDLAALAERRVDALSGGEWQRTRLARALAQQPEILLLDEPTAALDIRHEMEIFELVRRLVEGGLAGLIVTHQLNLAARYADEMLLLSEGRRAAGGPPAEVLRQDVLGAVFGWPVAVTTWCDGSPQVVPLRPQDLSNTARDPR
jgi:iron complex transport system ATP-binding protein